MMQAVIVLMSVLSVRPSVRIRHTSDPRVNGSRYRNAFWAAR